MTAGPLVSVIVPAYNAARFIGETLESVRAQTYEHLEIIVVDDGSHDETPQVVQAHAAADPRVRLVRQANKGVAAARNAAVAVARGVYLAPIDADDVWMPTKIEKQVECMERQGESVGLCYTWWLGIDEHGATRFASHPWHVEGEIANSHIALNFIGNASVPMIRRSYFDRVGGYGEVFWSSGVQGCEDWDLSLRIAELSRVSVVPEYLAGYRRTSGSMSGSLDTMVRSHLLMVQRLKARRPNVPRVLLRWSFGQLYGYTAAVAARTGEPMTALTWLARGILSPRVSFLSPWIAEIALAKMPVWLSGLCLPTVRRLEARWY